MKGFFGFLLFVLVFGLLSLLGQWFSRLYGWENRFPTGRFLATTDISLKEYRDARLRLRGREPKEPLSADDISLIGVDIPFVGMNGLSQAAKLYGQRIYPPKDHTDGEQQRVRRIPPTGAPPWSGDHTDIGLQPWSEWVRSHVKMEKVDETTIRLTVSGESGEEAENSLKQIMDIYIDLFVRMQEGPSKAFRGLPIWSGKAKVTKL